jgi:hypothetical protein
LKTYCKRKILQIFNLEKIQGINLVIRLNKLCIKIQIDKIYQLLIIILYYVCDSIKFLLDIVILMQRLQSYVITNDLRRMIY